MGCRFFHGIVVDHCPHSSLQRHPEVVVGHFRIVERAFVTSSSLFGHCLICCMISVSLHKAACPLFSAAMQKWCGIDTVIFVLYTLLSPLQSTYLDVPSDPPFIFTGLCIIVKSEHDRNWQDCACHHVRFWEVLQ